MLVSETVPIVRQTVPGLIETFRDAFRSPFKVETLRYSRGEEYIAIERLVPQDRMPPKEDGGDEFLSACQMVRQHADLEVQEPYEAPLESVARAVQSLSARNLTLRMFVVESQDVVRAWLGKDLRLEDIWQVPLVEDPEAHDDGLFVCGSRAGTMVRDIEAAVFCRMK